MAAADRGEECHFRAFARATMLLASDDGNRVPLIATLVQADEDIVGK